MTPPSPFRLRSRRKLRRTARQRAGRARAHFCCRPRGCARGCTSSRPPIHINPSMDDQPKVRPQTASTFFYDGASMRQPVPGTVPIGGLKEDAAFFTGKGADGQFVATIPVTVDDGASRARPPAVCDLLPALPRRSGGRQGDPVPARQRPHRLLPPGEDPEVPGRADLRRHHERDRADGRVPLADPSGGQVGDRRLRARARAQAAGKRRGRARLRRGYGGQARGRQVNGTAVMNRKLLVLLGPVAALVMFAGTVKMASWLREPRVQEPYRAPSATVDPTPRAAGLADEAAAAAKQAQAKPYEEARVPEVSRRRKPRGHLGGRAASPAVRGVRPCRPDLRAHRRGDRLQDRRHAIRPARVRVHEAPLRVLLAHRDLRSGPDVHAHHSVSEVHELPDERVLSHLPPVRPALLLRSLLPLHLLLRLGEVPSPGASRPGARPQRRRHGASC